jgi:hypothetical protein
MPSRMQQFRVYPWTGGLVTSIDESLIQPGQLTRADNVLFSTQGTRLKRPGIDSDWDSAAISVLTRSSSGTSRTLTTSGYKWTVGDQLTVSGAGNTNYNTGTTTATVTAVDSTVKSTVTISNASPGVVTWNAHGLSNDDPVIFTTTGSLPTGLTAGRVYFVRNQATNTFEVATAPGGTSINTSSAGSGTHTVRKALEDVVTYTFAGAGSLSESSTADTAISITLKTKIIALHDYWYGTTSEKTQRLMAFSSVGRLYAIDTTTGIRTLIEDGGTPYTVPSGGILRASMVTFDNRLIVACEGSSNVMKHYFPSSLGGSGAVEDVTNTTNFAATPKASFLQVHLGRLFCNDKENPDRLHYCETGTYNVWQGAGDSGAFDIGANDGDPEGITAIFPPFKGVLFIAKRTKLYKLPGQYPETITIDRVSSSLGCVAHQAVAAIDQDDVLFVSDKGIHSAQATDVYGDFSQSYVSADIQTSINDDWNRSRQKFIQSAYLPQINSVAFCVAEESDSSQQDTWLYNFALKQWYRWPDVNCTSVCVANDVDRQRFYFGRNDGRISQALTDNNYDTDSNGNDVAIVMTIATGLIFPAGDPLSSVGYKRLSLIYRPTGTYTITANFKIDNFSTQSLLYNEGGGQDLLGSTFVLNQSVLGLSQVTTAFTQPVDGYGRGFKLTLQQSGLNEFGEILGFVVFFESTEPVYEVRASDDE